MTDHHVHLYAVWFNQPYLKEQLTSGRPLTVTGKYDAKRRSIAVSQHEWHHQAESAHSGRVIPVYRVRGELTPKVLRSFVLRAIKQFAHLILDPLPEEMRSKYRLMQRTEAIRVMHFPKDGEDLKQAKRRLIFEEFFLFQLQLQAFRWLHRFEKNGIAHPCKGDDVRQFL